MYSWLPPSLWAGYFSFVPMLSSTHNLNMTMYVGLLSFVFLSISVTSCCVTECFHTDWLQTTKVYDFSGVLTLLGLAGCLCAPHVVIHLAALNLKAGLAGLGQKRQTRFSSNVWILGTLSCGHSMWQMWLPHSTMVSDELHSYVVISVSC